MAQIWRSRHTKIVGIAVASLALIGIGLVKKYGAQGMGAPTTQPHPPTAAAIEVWDGGVHMMGIKPYVLFAAWPDGTVVRRVDDQLYTGRVDPGAIGQLLDEARSAGVLNPPLEYGLVRVDGPFKTLCVRSGGQRIRVDYDETTNLKDLSPGSMPSREQVESFVRMWYRIQHAISQVHPSTMQLVTGNLSLEYPAR